MSTQDHQVQLNIRRYDLQGILVPGAIVVVCLTAFALKRYGVGAQSVSTWIAESFQHTPPAILIALLAILAMYVIGHVIDGLAQFFYEEIYMRCWRGFTFPYLIALNSEDAPSTPVWLRDLYIQFAVSCSVALVFCLPFTRHYRYAFGNSLQQVLAYLPWILFVLAALFVALAMHGHATQPITTGTRWTSFCKRVLSAPFRWLDHGAQLLVPIREKLDETRLKLFEECFHRAFGMSTRDASRDGYWLVYFRIMESLPHSRDRINRAVNHAVLSRNISFACYFGSFILAFGTNMGGDSQRESFGSQFNAFTSDVSERFLVASFAMLVMSYLWFTRFHHWFDYMTKMIVRVFLASELGSDQRHRQS